MEIERRVMIELVVGISWMTCVLLIYKIFKRGFLHDSKRADNRHQWLHSFVIIASLWHVYDVTTRTLILDSLGHVLDLSLMLLHIHFSYAFHIHPHHWSLPPVSQRSLPFLFLVLVTLFGFGSSHTLIYFYSFSPFPPSHWFRIVPVTLVTVTPTLPI